MTTLAFFTNAKELPPVKGESTKRGFETLAAKIANSENRAAIETTIADENVRRLLGKVFSASPFLSNIILRDPDFFSELCVRGADESFNTLKASLKSAYALPETDLMKAMRVAKSKASLLTALADIAGIWPLEQVTLALSEFAALCIRLTLAFLLREAAARGNIALKHPDNPERESGVFVLAMGKLGAYELNYSSDIDLIVFFEKEQVHYTGNSDVQHCLAKLVHEMVRLLQERTADGYVFRVDLRLRPDPASTLAAMSVAGAMTYYETVGQNWERAAFIKARPIAGDLEAGRNFLKGLTPFLWRKHLDFAAIADIQSIKRQMDERGGTGISVAGHNIKTGTGGIREIEFFAQIHQLIWGGRIPNLRVSGTCNTLRALVASQIVEEELAEMLIRSYRYLRHVEHRLQMVDDQQTHTVPAAEDARTALAEFMGYENREAFEHELLAHLNLVHEHFSHAFRGPNSLSSDKGKLSFTGVENDPRTVETLMKMGYQNPGAVSQTIQGWHRGTRRATRTKRARELITELTPAMLKAFAATSYPDLAFMKFDEFLAKLPSGVQLFSLFNNNPQLLHLIAVIMGSAPAMAESLSKHPTLLDTVLTPDFYDAFADQEMLSSDLNAVLLSARDFEDEIDTIRRFKNEKQFQAGVQLITGKADIYAVGQYLSDIADVCVVSIMAAVAREFAVKNPGLPPEQLAIIVLGRLGAQELTFGSDIDIVFVYGGDMSQHALYNKLSQRFISGLTVLTREGWLYAVDTRLRPSGKDGALSVSTDAFEKYFREAAWTFERMAFTRARVITGAPALRKEIASIISSHILMPPVKEKLVKDIIDLRIKITHEFGSDNIWNLKYVHGGLIDFDFLAQYFVLLYAHTHPDIAARSSNAVFRALTRHGLMEEATCNALLTAHRFLTTLLALLRLCGGGAFDESTAPPGLKQLLMKIMQAKDFEELKKMLAASIATVKIQFDNVLYQYI